MRIGQEITVTHAKNKTLNGTKGRIIDETKHTLIIETENGRKTIIKDQLEE